mmetsp:Transcript_66093/g.138048  ORF Transcript_66093/g.138048 Transcript_66093/m.138048 type:complete len:224 (-) Transcript_66093:358-1029(-)
MVFLSQAHMGHRRHARHALSWASYSQTYRESLVVSSPALVLLVRLLFPFVGREDPESVSLSMSPSVSSTCSATAGRSGESLGSSGSFSPCASRQYCWPLSSTICSKFSTSALNCPRTSRGAGSVLNLTALTRSWTKRLASAWPALICSTLWPTTKRSSASASSVLVAKSMKAFIFHREACDGKSKAYSSRAEMTFTFFNKCLNFGMYLTALSWTQEAAELVTM